MNRKTTTTYRSHGGARTALVALCFIGLSTTGGALRAELSPVKNAAGKLLGSVNFPSSCSDGAQALIERGLALMHHMTYAQAEPTFASAAATDPECALAHWGQAMTFIHPLWPDRPSAEQLQRGRSLLERATRAEHTSDREQAYVAALAGYYEGDNRPERERLGDYLAGFAALHESYPEDGEAALFHALALLANAPGTDKSYATQREAGAIAERVLAANGQHPGAHHYIIHAYDFPPLAERALDAARSYDEVAPENSHALHMTSHIFTRRGLWPESVEFNLRAERAARERTPAGTVSMHRLHALDYLAYAYLQQAEHDAAEETLELMRSLEAPFQNHAGTVYSFAAVPARLALERHDWKAAARVADRWPADLAWDQYPYLDAIPVFARALGAARTGDLEGAGREIERLAELRQRASELDIAYDWGTQVAAQELAARGWLAFAAGDTKTALEQLRRAADLEAATEKNPVTPGEVLPASELLGDLLLELGLHREAIEQYEAALSRSPNRFNSVYGAGRAAELDGDRATAERFYRQLLEIASGSRAEIAHARDYLDRDQQRQPPAG